MDCWLIRVVTYVTSSDSYLTLCFGLLTLVPTKRENSCLCSWSVLCYLRESPNICWVNKYIINKFSYTVEIWNGLKSKIWKSWQSTRAWTKRDCDPREMTALTAVLLLASLRAGLQNLWLFFISEPSYCLHRLFHIPFLIASPSTQFCINVPRTSQMMRACGLLEVTP